MTVQWQRVCLLFLFFFTNSSYQSAKVERDQYLRRIQFRVLDQKKDINLQPFFDGIFLMSQSYF